jgi:hypothetical protein
MKRCSTSVVTIGLAIAFVQSFGARAEEWRGSATPGLTLHFPTSNFGDADLSSWTDRYDPMIRKDEPVPWFADLFHAELEWLRDDGSPLFHFERWSPSGWNDHGLLDAEWRGLSLHGDAYRFRTDVLRQTPVGTGDTGVSVLPRLGSHYNDGTDPDDLFFVRRYGGGGEIELAPERFGFEGAPFTRLTFYGSQQLRTGQRQDSFLLDPEEVGTGPDTARFRGRTRDLDQEVTTLGGRLVAVPFGIATTALDVSWQRFRETAPTTLVGDLTAVDPLVRPVGDAALRALFFVPDTDRLTGTLRASRRIGEATLHGGAFASRLDQVGTKPPLQRQAKLRGNDVTTVSAHLAADVPITEWLGFDTYGKAVFRNNGLPRDTTLFGPDNRTQLAPFLRELREVRGGAEFVAAPMLGSRVALGYGVRDVDRDLEYASTIAADGIAQRAITPEVSLVHDDSREHTVYLRGHARLLRRTRISAETGYRWAPAIGMPTELESLTFAEARITHGLRAPIPATLALFGHFEDGSSDGWTLESSFVDRSQDKDYERRDMDWGLSISAMPIETLTLYATFTQQWDRQRFPHVRSNVPRPNGAAFVRFFLDSELGWQSDVRMFAVGGLHQVTSAVDVSLGGWLGWVDAKLPRGGQTADAITNATQIDLFYASTEAAVGVRVLPSLRVGLAYRFDTYRDDARIDSPDLDGHDHSVTLSATYDFAFGGGPP